MNPAARYQFCLATAARLVAAYRAAAPEDCDPQNVFATTGVVGGLAAAATVAGAGAAIYGATQAGKGSGQSRSVGELGGLPYGQQLDQAKAYADAQFDLNRRQADLGLQYGPLYAQQQRAETEALAQSLLKLYPQFAKSERTQTTRTRAQDLVDFQKNAGGWAGALDAASPAYRAIGDEVRQGEGSPLLDRLNAQALTAGHSPLRDALEKQALYNVQLGGSLSPEDERLAQQSARGAWSDRGLLYSNPAAAAEILNRDAISQQRSQQRQQWGATVQGLALNEDTTNHNFGIGVQGANEASAGNWRNFLVAGSQAETNPLLQAGMQRTPINPLSLGGLYSQGGQGASQFAQISTTAPSIYQGAAALSPLYNYSNDVYGTNFAAAESRANASANAYSALGSGLMNVGGSLYGNYLRGGSSTLPNTAGYVH